MKNKFLIGTLSLFFLFSCSGGGEQESNSEHKSADEVKEQVAADAQNAQDDGLNEEEEEEFNFVMPSALQITSIFSRTGTQFTPEVINDLGKVNSYVTKESKLMNLGCYTSDLCYCVLNNQSQLSIDYLKAVKSLSEDVGMAAIFNSGPLFERFEANIGNRDSIILIMADLQEQTDLYVKRSDQEHLAMVIFAGAWTEGMYIGLNTAESLDKGSDIIPRIVEQMTLLSNLIKGLEVQPKQTDELKVYIEKFTDLRDYFENIEGVDLQMFEYDLNKITEDHINEIKSKITSIRGEIVQANS